MYLPSDHAKTLPGHSKADFPLSDSTASTGQCPDRKSRIEKYFDYYGVKTGIEARKHIYIFTATGL